MEVTFDVDKWFKMTHYAWKSYINTSLIEASYSCNVAIHGTCKIGMVRPRGYLLLLPKLWHGGNKTTYLVVVSTPYGFRRGKGENISIFL